MGDKSGIQWTDATWNPVTGCSKVSPGCAHCYAETLTKRYAKQWGVPGLPWTPANAEQNVILKPERLDQPLRWTKPRMVFVNSMSDLFHEQVPVDYIIDVFAVMAAAPRHTFQVLTKRPERMRAVLALDAFWAQVRDRMGEHTGLIWVDVADEPMALRNVWLGTSIENRRFVHRADLLRETPAAVRFISAEPLLGPLVPEQGRTRKPADHPEAYMKDHDHGKHRDGECRGCEREARNARPGDWLDLANIDWLIVGGESGPGYRPPHLGWLRDLRDACDRTHVCDCMVPAFEGAGQHAPDCSVFKGTAFFFKQFGGTNPKANGRELDGRTWDEMPEVRS